MRRNCPALSEHDSPPQRGVVYPLHVDTLSRPELVSSLTLRACEQEPSAAWVLKVGKGYHLQYCPLRFFGAPLQLKNLGTKELAGRERQGEWAKPPSCLRCKATTVAGRTALPAQS